MNWVTELLTNLIYDVTADIMSVFGDVINDVYALTLEINNTQIVNSLTTLTSAIGISLIVLMVIKQMIGTYALETEGDPERNPINVLYRVGKCVVIIACNSWLFGELTTLSYAVGRDIDKIFSVSKPKTLIDALLNSVNGSGGGPAKMLCTGILTIGFVLFSIAAVLRGAELTLDRILLPIFAVDSVNSNPEKWNMFSFQYAVSFFSYLVQYACFKLMLLFCERINASNIRDFAIYFLLTIGWLVLTLKSPQILEKYIYATGTGKAVGNGASRLGQVIMFVGMRR